MTDLTQGHLLPGVAKVLEKFARSQPLTQQDIDLVNAQLQSLPKNDPNYDALSYIAKQQPAQAAPSASVDPAAEASFAQSPYATPAKSQPAQAGSGGLGLPTMDWATGLGDLLHGGSIGLDTSTGNIQPMTPGSPLSPSVSSTAQIAADIQGGKYAGGANADMAGTDQTEGPLASALGSIGAGHGFGFSGDSLPQPGTAGTQTWDPSTSPGSPIPAEMPAAPSFAGDILNFPGHSFSGNVYGAQLASADPMVWAHMYQTQSPDNDPASFDAQMLQGARYLAALGVLGNSSGNDLTTGPKSDAAQMALAEDFLNHTIKQGNSVNPSALYHQILQRAAATDPGLISATPGAGAGSSSGNDDPQMQVHVTNNALFAVAPFTGKLGSDTLSVYLNYMGQQYLNGLADGSIHMTYPQYLQSMGADKVVGQ